MEASMSSDFTYSPEFYRKYAERYAQVSHELIQGIYIIGLWTKGTSVDELVPHQRCREPLVIGFDSNRKSRWGTHR